jgi:hypothetical protein
LVEIGNVPDSPQIAELAIHLQEMRKTKEAIDRI